MSAVRTVLAWVKANPVRVASLATLILGWLALAGVPAGVIGGLGTLLTIVLGGPIHATVTPVASAVATVKAAASNAAVSTATRLGQDGASVALNAAYVAADDALVGLGVSAKARAVGTVLAPTDPTTGGSS